MSAIEVAGLVHGYGRGSERVEVVGGLDLRVEPGDFVSLVGPRGCGKSTLLHLLAGLAAPDGGTISVGGQAAYQPQRDALLPWRRALANATLGAEIRGVPATEARARAGALFDRFGLSGFETSWPWQLSGGMRQRLALLRTFLTPADVLLLDEPFGALDAITRRSFQQWLEGVWMQDRRTVVFVTHDVEEALLLSDRVVVLSPRPACVVAEVPSPYVRPRAPELVTDRAFVSAKAELLTALDHPPPH
ncbi:MAG TPA: ABC transporter ATP-binding protein [Acidimicrobiales bacterium]|nr:ABC transporter ATP-binding protein [Acidimicrobiales bacterium]